MARKERIKAIIYTHHPDGPDGPAVFSDLSGFTNDPAVLSMFDSEVQRHILLYLAECAGEGVPDHPSAYMIEVVGLSVRPWRKRVTIPINALAYQVRTPGEVITYEVHSIRTARGRLLRSSGASRAVNESQAEAMLSLASDEVPAQ